MTEGNVSQFPGQRSLPSDGGGNGGNGIEKRLRDVELDVREIRTSLQHVSTKEDIQRVKVWALSGVIAGMGLAAGIALGLARLLSG